MGEHMGPHVVHRPEGQAAGPRETARKGAAHQQGAVQARASRVGDAVQVIQGEAGLFKDTVQHGQDVSLVRPGGKFRHHAAILGMNVLGSRELGHELRTTQHGNAGVVAGTFDAEHDALRHLVAFFVHEFSIPHHSMPVWHHFCCEVRR